MKEKTVKEKTVKNLIILKRLLKYKGVYKYLAILQILVLLFLTLLSVVPLRELVYYYKIGKSSGFEQVIHFSNIPEIDSTQGNPQNIDKIIDNDKKFYKFAEKYSDFIQDISPLITNFHIFVDGLEYPINMRYYDDSYSYFVRTNMNKGNFDKPLDDGYINLAITGSDFFDSRFKIGDTFEGKLETFGGNEVGIFNFKVTAMVKPNSLSTPTFDITTNHAVSISMLFDKFMQDSSNIAYGIKNDIIENSISYDKVDKFKLPSRWIYFKDGVNEKEIDKIHASLMKLQIGHADKGIDMVNIAKEDIFSYLTNKMSFLYAFAIAFIMSMVIISIVSNKKIEKNIHIFRLLGVNHLKIYLFELIGWIIIYTISFLIYLLIEYAYASIFGSSMAYYLEFLTTMEKFIVSIIILLIISLITSIPYINQYKEVRSKQ